MGAAKQEACVYGEFTTNRNVRVNMRADDECTNSAARAPVSNHSTCVPVSYRFSALLSCIVAARRPASSPAPPAHSGRVVVRLPRLHSALCTRTPLVLVLQHDPPWPVVVPCDLGPTAWAEVAVHRCLLLPLRRR